MKPNTKNILCVAGVAVLLVVGSLAVGFTSVESEVKTEPVMEDVNDRTQQKLDKIINKIDDIKDKIEEFHGE